jgi:hypothetical protein
MRWARIQGARRQKRFWQRLPRYETDEGCAQLAFCTCVHLVDYAAEL